jgi:hypothetical protein
LIWEDLSELSENRPDRLIQRGNPGIENIQTSHLTIAPVVKDPTVMERLTPLVVPYSHLHHNDSTDPNKCVADPIIGLETGSSRLFDIFMKGKAYPYRASQWRDVVLKGMELLNKHNWFPFCTFIIGLPGETEKDTKESLDLLFEFALLQSIRQAPLWRWYKVSAVAICRFAGSLHAQTSLS